MAKRQLYYLLLCLCCLALQFPLARLQLLDAADSNGSLNGCHCESVMNCICCLQSVSILQRTDKLCLKLQVYNKIGNMEAAIILNDQLLADVKLNALSSQLSCLPLWPGPLVGACLEMPSLVPSLLPSSFQLCATIHFIFAAKEWQPIKLPCVHFRLMLPLLPAPI